MKKVVSATLAGALAVGMVPAMALADDAVELQAQTEAEAIADGTIVLADGQKAGQEFVVGSEDACLTPVSVQIAEGVVKAPTTVKIYKTATTGVFDGFYTKDAEGAVVPYYYESGKVAEYTVDSLGEWTVVGTPGIDIDDLAVGNYAAAVMVGSTKVKQVVPFSIVAKSLDGASFYEPVATGTETYADTTFVFNGEDWEAGSELQLVLGGKGVASTDYAATAYYNSANKKLTGGALPQAAGKYSVDILGATGKDFENSKENVAFEIKAVDLKDITFTLTPQSGATIAEPAIASYTIDGVTYGNTGALYSYFETSFDKPVNAAGSYTATISLASTLPAPWKTSITGTTSVDFTLGAKVADLSAARYNGNDYFTAADDAADPDAVTVDLAVNRADAVYAEFDPAKVTLPKVKGAAAVYALEYQKANDKNQWVPATLADVTDASAFGTFRVRAVLDAAHYGYEYYGATDWMEISTTNGTVASSGVTFVYDNGVSKNVVTGIATGTVAYDGTDLMEDIAITVKAGEKVLSASDYTVKIVKKGVGTALDKEVTEIIDAGTYVISVSSTKYNVNPAQEITVVVDPLKVDLHMIDAFDCDNVDCDVAAHNDLAVLYTGDVIDPIAKFTKKVGTKDVEVAVPADAVKVTVKSLTPEGKTTAVAASEIKEAGLYVLEIADAKNGVEADNFELNNGGTYYLHVSARNVFADVKADAWYADEVLYVAQKGWITGYSSNGLFGPNDGMKRGDLAVVLARYLKTTGTLSSPLGSILEGIIVGDALVSVDTGFSDVKGGAYYARAIKAMNEAGIMTGYEDGTYGPEDLVTRQMLATILARVEASGLAEDGATLLADALAAYADADEVSSWAAAGVEWAVENGIMGVDTAFLNPTDTVTRAEVAAMLVRYDAIEA